MALFTLILMFLSPIQLADSLYKEADYYNAITEYKRAVYLQDSVEYALYKIGLSYEKRRKYDFAAKYFGRLAYEKPSKEVSYHLALSLIYLKKYEDASLVLEGEKDKNLKMLFAVSEGLSGNFKEADSILYSMGIKPPPYPQPSLLRYPSYLIPGFGLFLIGEYKRAVLSLLFTSASGYLSYRLLKEKRYPEAIVFINTLFLRFYFGNIENALKIRKEKKKRFYSEILDKYTPN